VSAVLATTPGLGRLVFLILLGCIACACGTSSAASTRSIVALGDSVPRGQNCSCTPYPELSAGGLSKSTGKSIKATNDSVSGYTSKNVLAQLKDNTTVIDHVRAADAIEVEIGANDVGYNKSCGTKVSCYTPHMPALKKNLAAIVRRVRVLTAGHKALIVLLDYWSVWLGGSYAKAHGEAYVAAAEAMTDQVDTAIKNTATRSKSAYVDLRAAFKGPSYSYDETHYLSSDGDHPNAAGHRQIADATETVIEKKLDFG
jgi:lysophospholipase L1-like esterase